MKLQGYVMTIEEAKRYVGNYVECVDNNGVVQSLTVGQRYKVDAVDVWYTDIYFQIENLGYFYSHRFKPRTNYLNRIEE